ncbi:MAG: WcaI family glycosyltransferase [Sporocytophaga sp.]|uniref:WcaI family glycosyltransferase n=1 Tax=Sporocytophaga sp. TaxID=2231183 RepID=UPI001B0EC736|nr:WcaI family glycosyltransferase [Sporocytophaga sp.]MBO9699676.1 WcaI family glycosyltransferase [Sporocytophaga sp.]
MRILVFGINYAPELTGIGKYTGEMCEWLAEHGHEVEVITSMPYYPEWKIRKAYQGRWWFTETINKVKVRRTVFYVPEKVTGTTRIAHEFSFLLSSSIWWFKSLFRKYDLVISPYPPLIIGAWPYIYSRFHKTKWVFHIQDLQVDAARDLGLIKNDRLLNVLEYMEKFFLRKADYVSSISDGMKMKILGKGIDAGKYIMLPNWVDTDFIRPMPKNDSMRSELGFEEKDIIILYSGNMGEKQGLEAVIPIAQKFADRSEVKIVLAGEGAAKERLMKETEANRLKNITFLPIQAYEKLSAFLAIADFHLVLQKKAASDLLLPSKLLSILSAGGCAIVTAVDNSSLHKMIGETNAGWLAEPENIGNLISILEKAIDSPLENTLKKENARKYALKYLNKDEILKDFQNVISGLS